MTERNLRITHYSGRYTLQKEHPELVKADAKKLFSLNSHLYSFTEQLEMGPTMAKLADKAGFDYRRRGAQALMVKRSPFVRILKTGYIETHPPLKSDSGATIGASSGIYWMMVSWYGETVFLHTAHMPTVTLTKMSRYKNLHAEESLLLSQKVREHGKGKTLSFFSGDFNRDQSRANETFPHKVFKKYGLVTVQEELSRFPATHGSRGIDYIGSYRADSRVTAKRIRVSKMNSDHRTVTAVYAVKLLNPTKTAA